MSGSKKLTSMAEYIYCGNSYFYQGCFDNAIVRYCVAYCFISNNDRAILKEALKSI